MLPKNIPDDINVELLLSLFPEGQCKVAFTGTHNRNVHNDFMGFEEITDDTLLLRIGRSSLYNALPELLFHPNDRFDNLSQTEDKEKFEKQIDMQEQEVEQAHKFFAPIDLLLLQLRMMVREKANAYAETNKVMIDIIGDRITEAQKQNRFIRKTLPFLPLCKSIRGNKTFLTLMLRKILMEEGLSINVDEQKHRFTDPNPKYNIRLENNSDTLYLGNNYDEVATTYTIHYWPQDDCDEAFLHLVDELETFRQFIQDYYIAVDGILRFDISCDDEPLRLSDETKHNYLNYNTNI